MFISKLKSKIAWKSWTLIDDYNKGNLIVKCDSDEDSFTSDNDNMLEIGPPRSIKYQSSEHTKLGQEFVRNEENFSKSFWGKELKDFLKGKFTCEFCQSLSSPWPNILNQNAYNSPSVSCLFSHQKRIQKFLRFF